MTAVAPYKVDPPAAEPGVRTLGTGPQQAAAGNDPRLTGAVSSSDLSEETSAREAADAVLTEAVTAIQGDSRWTNARTPTGAAGGALSGTYPSPSIAAGAVGASQIASAIKDPDPGEPGLRTLGTGANQAAAGDDPRIIAAVGADDLTAVSDAAAAAVAAETTARTAADQTLTDSVAAEAAARVDADASVANTAATALATHEGDTTSVHGIADTSALETTAGAQTKADAAQAAAEAASDPAGAADAAVAAHSADTTAVHGIADTSALVLTSDARLSDQRVPTDGSVTSAKIVDGTIADVDISATAAIAESKLALASDAAPGTASRRTLGTGATQAAAGNDARLSDARTPTGAAGGVLSGTYPNPGFAADMATQAELDAETSARTSADALLAPLASPAFTGTPTAPTPTAGDSTTEIATTAFVAGAVTAPIAATTQAADYTLALADAGTVIETTKATGINVTVPPNSSVAFPVGTMIELAQIGAGQITLVAGAGVTLRTPSSLTSRAQYSTLGLRKRATDEWVVSGDLT